MWGSVCFSVLMEGRASCELNFGGQESLPCSPQGDFHYRDVTDTCLMGTDPCLIQRTLGQGLLESGNGASMSWQ